MLRAPRAGACVATVSARVAQRQRAQIDGSDVGAGHRAGSYQAFQHFITDAPWNADAVWRRLRAVLPEREGLLIFDGTSFPKQGTHSVGVARQYCGTLGKIANCQVAVTAALWTGVRAYLLGAALYLPDEWVTTPARARARIPATVAVQEKWRQALRLLRQVRASGFTVTGVLADAEFGDNRALSRHVASAAAAVHRRHLVVPHRLFGNARRAVASPISARWSPAHVSEARVGVHARPLGEAIRAAQGQWRRIRWRNRAEARRWTAECLAIRVTPAVDSRQRRLAPEIWLLAERDVGETPRTKFYFVKLATDRVAGADRPAGASPVGDRAAVSEPRDGAQVWISFKKAPSRGGITMSCSPR